MLTGNYNYTPEMIKYKLNLIEQFFGEKPENDDEETVVLFIKEREEKLQKAIDNTFDFINKIHNSRVFEFYSEDTGLHELIVADTQSDATKLLVESLHGILLEIPEHLEVKELDVFKEEMLVDIYFVPESDQHLWERSDDNTLLVPLVYCIDYQQSRNFQEAPYFLV